MKLAYRLSQDAFRNRPKKFGRKDFTVAHLFACLVVREMLRQADSPHYRHRAQIETVNSMMNRNMGDELRSRLKPRRKRELLLRTVVHDIMLAAGLEVL